MIRPPFMARVAAGIALTLVEEARQLPTTAVALPMTSVSLLLQTSMRVQQTMTSLAIKGDEAFAFLYPASEKPAWAQFDDDSADPAPAEADEHSHDGAAGSPGRFALYSAPLAATRGRGVDGAAPDRSADAPPIAEEIGYDDLTLAQLRPRLRSLNGADLAGLLDYERAGAARAPYLTMLENRLSAAAK